ncbi:MAG: hypothetical protein ACTSQJ_11620, partial [Promethearchaeota archaeon]
FMQKMFEKNVPQIIPDPSIDDENEIYSFFVKPNMQLGLPGEEYATRVDYDGQLDTAIGKYGGGKFLFFLGDNIEPVQRRIWTLSKGYLPEINYNIEREGIKYTFRVFQFWLEEDTFKYPINFVQVDAENLSAETKEIFLYCGMLFSQYQNKILMVKRPKFNSKWTYFMNENGAAYRNNKLMYLSDKNQKPTALYSKLTKDNNSRKNKLIPYEGKFKGNKMKIKRDTITLIQEYKTTLKQKEKKKWIFKVPHYPIKIIHGETINLLKKININEYRKKFETYWEGLLEKCSSIILPEKKVIDTYKASLVYNFMCQNFHKDGRIEQHVNRFQYNRFWIRDSSFYSKMYSQYNRIDVSKRLLTHFLSKQKRNGNFMSQMGQFDGWGQSLWAFGEYIKLSGDIEFATQIFDSIIKAIKWFAKTIKKDKWGIMPPVFAADNEMISGRYTGHNFWAWCGLNNAEYIAEILNRKKEKEFFSEVKNKFLNNFKLILEKVCEKTGQRIPPGLDTDIGEDWSNLLMIYPQKLLDVKDPKIKTTLEDYRKNKMPEGIAMWMIFQHHYITERIAQQHLILDDQELVLKDFYSMLSHTGSCHEGFEHNIRPWGNRDYLIPIKFLFLKRDYFNYPPHGWFAVAYNLLLRNMLIREENGKLHLLSAISPEWINGNIAIKNANTYFGLCNLEVIKQSKNDYLKIIFKADFNRLRPTQIIIHLPFFINKESFIIDCKFDYDIDSEKTKIYLNPTENFELELKWELNSNIDLSYLSYEKAMTWLKSEYKKRYLKQISKET